jgi:hypothetical protein
VVHLAHYVPHKQGANITFEPDWQKQAVLGHEQLLEMAVVPGACSCCVSSCSLYLAAPRFEGLGVSQADGVFGAAVPQRWRAACLACPAGAASTVLLTASCSV